MGVASSGSSIITDVGRFRALCDRIRAAPKVAFDTEFIPEKTYHPELCLIQVATDDELAVADPLALGSATSEFWQAIVQTEGQVIVHAGRHEMDFCIRAAGSIPKNLFDVQIAAGFVNLGYPLSYANLVGKIVGKTPRSAETRTDWSRRPLLPKQLEYALDDVRYLIDVAQSLEAQLQAQSRRAWFDAEQLAYYSDLDADGAKRTRRIGGTGGLRPKNAAVLREILEWREKRSREANRPTRWTLRDDIAVELAKRAPTSIEDLLSMRGLGGDAKSAWVRDLLAAIKRGLESPQPEVKQVPNRRETPEDQMVVKLLSAALIEQSRDLGIATSLVGSNDDLFDLLDWYRRGRSPEDLPSLMQDWRAEVAGNLLVNVLTGGVVVRVLTEGEDVRLHFEQLDSRSDKTT